MSSVNVDVSHDEIFAIRQTLNYLKFEVAKSFQKPVRSDISSFSSPGWVGTQLQQFHSRLVTQEREKNIKNPSFSRIMRRAFV